MYLIYYIDEDLGIVPGEAPDYTSLVVVQEYFCNQIDTLACGEGVTD